MSVFVFVCVCVYFLWAKSELHGWPSAEQRLWVGSGAQTADNGIWLPLTTAGPCPVPPIFKFPFFIWKEKYHQSTYNLYDVHWPPLALFHQYLSFRFSFEKKFTIHLHHTSTICMIYIDHRWALFHQYLSFRFSIVFPFMSTWHHLKSASIAKGKTGAGVACL